MQLEVRVIPKAGRRELKEEGGILKVWVTSPASGGRANRELIEVLAEHFGVPKSMVRILRGKSSRRKLVEVQNI